VWGRLAMDRGSRRPLGQVNDITDAKKKRKKPCKKTIALIVSYENNVVIVVATLVDAIA